MCFHARSRHHQYDSFVDELDPEEVEEVRERRKRRFVARATCVGTAFLVCMAIWLLSGRGRRSGPCGSSSSGGSAWAGRHASCTARTAATTRTTIATTTIGSASSPTPDGRQ